MPPFLTDLDSRAAIKGSRDPLGLQPIWTLLGRHLIGNLTTVTTSVRDFAVLLLGYYFAERAGIDSPDFNDLNIFLKWEQLAAYARGCINKDWSFRGMERVQRNIHQNDGNPTPCFVGRRKERKCRFTPLIIVKGVMLRCHIIWPLMLVSGYIN